MPVHIDQLTADLTPPPPPPAGTKERARPAHEPDPEALRRELERRAARARRLAAD